MAKQQTVEGFVNISIRCHPMKRHLARGWWVGCRDCRPEDSVVEEARDEHEYRPVLKVRQAARRKARHLFRKMLGRNPEESELRWSMDYLEFLPGDKNLKKAPKTAWVGRVWMGTGKSPALVTGPIKLEFHPMREQWLAVDSKGKRLREAAVGLGEFVHNHGARIADPDKAKVETWVSAVKTTLTALGKQFKEDIE